MVTSAVSVSNHKWGGNANHSSDSSRLRNQPASRGDSGEQRPARTGTGFAQTTPGPVTRAARSASSRRVWHRI